MFQVQGPEWGLHGAGSSGETVRISLLTEQDTSMNLAKPKLWFPFNAHVGGLRWGIMGLYSYLG